MKTLQWIFAALLLSVACTALPSGAQQGTITSTSPCLLPGTADPNRCNVTVEWTSTNSPVTCIWIVGSPPQLYACSGYSAGQEVWPWTSRALSMMQLRSHSNWPTLDPGWPSSAETVYTNSLLLGDTSIFAVDPTPVNISPSISISASPTQAISPATITLTASPYDSDGWVTEVSYFTTDGYFIGAVGPPFTLTVSGVVPGTFSVYGQARDNQGAKGNSAAVIIEVTSPPPVPPPQPSLVHATQLTASCADKFCIKLTGFTFAADAYVQVRRDNSSGPIVENIQPTLRSYEGDASTLEITISTPSTRDLMANEPGIWVQVVNPGTPPAISDAFNVVRDGGESIRGTVVAADLQSISGWACWDGNWAQPIQVMIREDHDNGPILASLTANLSSAYASTGCNNTTGHGFQFTFPEELLDGKTRTIYAIAKMPREVRYPHALLGGSPRILVFPNVPERAKFDSQSVPFAMLKSKTYAVRVSFKNSGTVPWSTSLGFRLVSVAPGSPPWQSLQVGPTSTVQPGQIGHFEFNVTAPSIAGTHTFQWQLRRPNGTLFGATSSPISVEVKNQISVADFKADPTVLLGPPPLFVPPFIPPPVVY